MHQVQFELTDQLYDQAERRAVEAGFKSVGEYIKGVVSDDLAAESANFDNLFTPERIAHIEAVRADIQAGGKTYTQAEVREHFLKRWESWPEAHAS